MVRSSTWLGCRLRPTRDWLGLAGARIQTSLGENATNTPAQRTTREATGILRISIPFHPTKRGARNKHSRPPSRAPLRPPGRTPTHKAGSLSPPRPRPLEGVESQGWVGSGGRGNGGGRRGPAQTVTCRRAWSSCGAEDRLSASILVSSLQSSVSSN